VHKQTVHKQTVHKQTVHQKREKHKVSFEKRKQLLFIFPISHT
jgi:hypothetical protein